MLWRNDDTPAYNLAVVVDDADQGIGEVVRGDDLLDTTPRQLLLQRLLGLPPPAYAHVPLVLGPDGARLAKRHGAVTLADRAARGETPADALAWMAASLGLAAPGEARRRRRCCSSASIPARCRARRRRSGARGERDGCRRSPLHVTLARSPASAALQL